MPAPRGFAGTERNLKAHATGHWDDTRSRRETSVFGRPARGPVKWRGWITDLSSGVAPWVPRSQPAWRTHCSASCFRLQGSWRPSKSIGVRRRRPTTDPAAPHVGCHLAAAGQVGHQPAADQACAWPERRPVASARLMVEHRSVWLVTPRVLAAWRPSRRCGHEARRIIGRSARRHRPSGTDGTSHHVGDPPIADVPSAPGIS
jgi:hypothetical protein